MQKQLPYNNIAIAVQSRISSSRLPAKALLPLFDKSILNFLIYRLSIALPYPIFLLTTLDSTDDLLIKQLPASSAYYRGSVNNVANRFISFASQHGFSTIVRVTADNPFTDPKAILELVSNFSPKDSYLSFYQSSILEGCNAEIFSVEALSSLISTNTTAYELEHVTPILRSIYSKRLTLNSTHSKEIINKFSLTIDTLDDYIKISRLSFQISSNHLNPYSIDHDSLLSSICSNLNYPSYRNHLPQD